MSKKRFCSQAVGLILCCLTIASPMLRAGETEPKEITADQAFDHAAQKCTVILKVESSRLLKDKQIAFLNSMKDYREENNFTVIIYRQALAKFQAKEIADPAAHFAGKTIAVTGDIELRYGKAQIIIQEPEQIQLRETKQSE